MGEQVVLAGQTIAFTGALTGPLRRVRRRAAFTLITAAGATPSRSVTRATTLLVATRDDTAKHARAVALGIPVIDAVQLARALGHPTLW